MNKTETMAIMGVLKAAYPVYYHNMTRADAEAVVNLWSVMFAEEPAALVTAAVHSYITSGRPGYPPEIGDIKRAVFDMTHPEIVREEEAVALVQRAVSNGYYHARDEFEALPPAVQRAVGSPAQLHAWAQMEEGAVQRTVFPAIRRAYRQIVEEEAKTAMLPQAVREMTARLQSGERMALAAKV